MHPRCSEIRAEILQNVGKAGMLLAKEIFPNIAGSEKKRQEFIATFKEAIGYAQEALEIYTVASGPDCIEVRSLMKHLADAQRIMGSAVSDLDED